MKFKLAFALALFTAAVPVFAQPHTVSAHVRQQTSHDRAPHIHEHGSQPHHEA